MKLKCNEYPKTVFVPTKKKNTQKKNKKLKECKSRQHADMHI